MPVPVSAAPAPAAPIETRPDPARARGRLGWLAIVAAALWPAVEAVRILAQPVHEVVFGDFALTELSARDAWGLHPT